MIIKRPPASSFFFGATVNSSATALRLTGRPTYLRSQLVRTRNRLYVPRIKSDYGKRTFRYYAPSVYNKLPNHLRTTDNVASFKKNLKTYLFSLAYDMENLTMNADFQL